MFLLVPAYPGCPGQTAVKWLLLLSVFMLKCMQEGMGALCSAAYFDVCVFFVIAVAEGLLLS